MSPNPLNTQRLSSEGIWTKPLFPVWLSSLGSPQIWKAAGPIPHVCPTTGGEHSCNHTKTVRLGLSVLITWESFREGIFTKLKAPLSTNTSALRVQKEVLLHASVFQRLFGPEGSVRGPSPPCKIEQRNNNPLFSCLDRPSERQLVIKLTSQRARALAVASQSIAVHSGGNSFFHGVPGQKASLARPRPAALALTNGNGGHAAAWAIVVRSLSNPWQPWRTKTDLPPFVLEVVPLSRHFHPQRHECGSTGPRLQLVVPRTGPVRALAVHLLRGRERDRFVRDWN